MRPNLVQIRLVTCENWRRKNKKEEEEENTAVKYRPKPFGIAMPCGLKTLQGILISFFASL